MTREDSSILMLRVALILLAEARRRGDFGDQQELAARAAELTDELSGGAPSPDPMRPLLQANLLRPDRIALSIAVDEGSWDHLSLGIDGIAFDEGGGMGLSAVRAEPAEMTEEEQAALARRRVEWEERMKRTRQFTATGYVRTVAAPPQPGADQVILAVELFSDGFYVESTYDQEPPAFDAEDEEAMLAALLADREGSRLQVEDDLGTDYFSSGAGGSSGVRVARQSSGFAPAPPAAARVLRITTESGTVELDLEH